MPRPTTKIAVILACVLLLGMPPIWYWRSTVGRAKTERAKVLETLNAKMKLPPNTDPIQHIVGSILAHRGKTLSAEELDTLVPMYNRVKIDHYDDGAVFARTYHFLPPEVDKHLVFGFWVSVRFKTNGEVDHITFEK